MIRRISFLSLALLLVAAVLVACGGAATPAPTPTTAPVAVADTPVPPTPTPVPPTPEPAPPTVTLVVWADNTRAPALLTVADRFATEYGVRLDIQEVGFGDIRDNVKLAAPAGEGPDVFIGAHDWIGELYINGLLAPIDLGAKAGEFFEPALSLFTYEGELVGLPYSTENVALFYNTELVPVPPATWDELIAISEELESSGAVRQGYVLQENDAYHYFPLMSAFGGYIFGRDAEGSYDPTDVGLDTPGALAAAQFLDQAVKDGHLVKDMDWDTMHVLFETGQSAMFITGPWALPRLRDAGVPYGIAPIPTATQAGAPFLGGQGFFINRFSDNQLLAQAFLLEFVATTDVMQALFDADPRPSAYLAVRDATVDPDFAAFGIAGESAQPMPTIPEMSAVWGALGDAITLIFQQSAAPDAAFENAAEQVRSAIEGG